MAAPLPSTPSVTDAAAAADPARALLPWAAESDPVLHRPAAAVPLPLSAEDQLLIARMCHCIQPAQLAASGAAWPSAVGMAAPQWCAARSVFLWCPSRRVDDPAALTVVLNARYEPLDSSPSDDGCSESGATGGGGDVDAEADTESVWEGCFSVPGRRGLVRRPRRIRVWFDTPQGERVSGRVLEGWEARVFMHECDHVRGFLYTTAVDAKGNKRCSEMKECTAEQVVAERAATAAAAAAAAAELETAAAQ